MPDTVKSQRKDCELHEKARKTVWVTMVIERALFLILAAVWVIKTHFYASRCSLRHFSAFSRLGVLLWPGFF